ncbi:hypothetical protein IW261DRAFT_1524319 [Armillaria novae-zelandiae]|uniref:Nephrocystin 3-like N-terminal domain-containing protein n=1 Tax=Armillaria novae-zelandiae TaxID=153914 RepID=A0AA39TMG7_9AGAR|nr:hypothetical protein IW261DRAFT_1524319 [Armillaria novae-zelandiae]
MIKTLAEVDPAADVAWSFLSKGLGVLRKKQTSDETIIGLYRAMFSAHISASREEVLKNRERLRRFYKTLFRQTIECAVFLEGYIAKNVGERPLSARQLDKLAEFQHAFRSMLGSTAQEATVVTLGVQEFVDPLRMQEQLHHLQPSVDLGPRSTCLRGTRVKTINTLMEWIAKCNGGVLWCKGTSGSGKSSLMGSLYELAMHASGRNRLGAFVRYDRIENSDSSRLIASIAYSLGMFDNRIGIEISRVHLSMSELLSLSPMKQFQQLLEQPLKKIPSLADEGPLIVIIDGLDECDVSDQLLSVLDNGFGKSLAFMRLIISTNRPILEQRLEKAPLVVGLDKSSEDTIHDIRLYIDSQLSELFAQLSAQNDSNPLKDACDAFRASETLTRRANGSFIWAATACRFIRDLPSISRLLVLLRPKGMQRNMNPMTSLYRNILDSIVAEAVQDKAIIKLSIRAVLGAIMISGTPRLLNAKALNTLVGLPDHPPPQLILAKLASVVRTSSDGFNRFFHMSFYDFLRDEEQCGKEWYIDT